MKRVLLIAAVLALVAGAGGVVWLKTRADAQNAVTVAQEQKQQPEPSKYDVGPPDPQEMLELVNEERRKVGVAPLALDDRLNASAKAKVDDMATNDYYGHESPAGIQGYTLAFREMNHQCSWASENLHILSGDLQNSRGPIMSWMESTKGHREAILDAKYDLVGFGTVKYKAVTLIAQHFCSLRK